MKLKNRLSICADDFGITKNVNSAIVKLIRLNRLTETSCIVLTKNFSKDAKKLKKYKKKIGIGLHLTLTDFKPLTELKDLKRNGKMISIKSLIVKSLTGNINENQIYKEIDSQINIFKKYIGFEPNFIDGHHHVHQLPVVRDCLVKVLNKRNLTNKIWVRNTDEDLFKIIKRKVCVIKTLLLSFYGKKFKHIAKKNLIKTNNGFSGIYDFSETKNYELLFDQFISFLKPNHLIMVHPGFNDKDLSKLDPVTTTRDLEFEFLSSKKFNQLIKRNNIVLKKMLN